MSFHKVLPPLRLSPDGHLESMSEVRIEGPQLGAFQALLASI